MVIHGLPFTRRVVVENARAYVSEMRVYYHSGATSQRNLHEKEKHCKASAHGQEIALSTGTEALQVAIGRYCASNITYSCVECGW
jgi:hypothetical protein